jgi:alpha-tubulin suppressor-like RCC1 family protein
MASSHHSFNKDSKALVVSEQKETEFLWPLGSSSEIIDIMLAYIGEMQQIFSLASLFQDVFNISFPWIHAAIGESVRLNAIIKVVSESSGIAAFKAGGSLWVKGLIAGYKYKYSEWSPFTVPDLKEPIATISLGNEHAIVQTVGYRVFGCGMNNVGQLGFAKKQRNHSVNSNDLFEVKVPDLQESITSAMAGMYHSFALTINGRLFACGDNRSGQLGLSKEIHESDSWVEVKIPGLEEPIESVLVIAVANSSFIFTTSGRLFACGYNYCGQLGLGDNENRFGWIEVKVPGLEEPIIRVSAQEKQTFIHTASGRLFACGNNQCGQLGLGDNQNRLNWTEIKVVGLEESIASVTTGKDHTFILTANHRLFACGSNNQGQLGLGDKMDRKDWTEVKVPELGSIIEVIAKGNHTLIRTKSGRLWACGYMQTDVWSCIIDSCHFVEISLAKVTHALLNERIPGYLKMKLKMAQMGVEKVAEPLEVKSRENEAELHEVKTLEREAKLTEVDFSQICLGVLSTTTPLFEALNELESKNKISLKLSNNDLNTWGAVTWKDFFAKLPQNVRRLDVSDNNLSFDILNLLKDLAAQRQMDLILEGKGRRRDRDGKELEVKRSSSQAMKEVKSLQGSFERLSFWRPLSAPCKMRSIMEDQNAVQLPQGREEKSEELLRRQLSQAIIEVESSQGDSIQKKELEKRYKNAVKVAIELIDYYRKMDKKPEDAKDISLIPRRLLIWNDLQTCLKKPYHLAHDLWRQAYSPASKTLKLEPLRKLLELGSSYFPESDKDSEPVMKRMKLI